MYKAVKPVFLKQVWLSYQEEKKSNIMSWQKQT